MCVIYYQPVFSVQKPKLVSLNPLPPERLLRGSSERSETTPGGDEDDDGEDASSSESAAETNASINGDVEDNLQERRLKCNNCQIDALSVPIPMCTYLFTGGEPQGGGRPGADAAVGAVQSRPGAPRPAHGAALQGLHY